VREQFRAQGGHFLNPSESDRLAGVVATPQRTLNPAIVGKSVEVIAKMAGLNVPTGTRCLLADVAGVGREYPLSMEKLSPLLAFYVEDGIERGAARCFEVLSYGGMGHTAGVHTRSRDAAIAYGREMPASRVTVNTPTTHGAIGFSTALPPSMTLGCGSWGGNVTSDNVSPLHLMDIKRVAFETRPVKSVRPAVSTQAETPMSQRADSTAGAPRISREEIAAIVDRFLANRPEEHTAHAPHATMPSQTQGAPQYDGEEGSMYDASRAMRHSSSSPAEQSDNGRSPGSSTTQPKQSGEPSSNGSSREAVDFVSEDDVRRAIQKGVKIIINARTIITPAARDIAEPAEVFSKV
jgi:hypothetical protein